MHGNTVATTPEMDSRRQLFFNAEGAHRRPDQRITAWIGRKDSPHYSDNEVLQAVVLSHYFVYSWKGGGGGVELSVNNEQLDRCYLNALSCPCGTGL